MLLRNNKRKANTYMYVATGVYTAPVASVTASLTSNVLTVTVLGSGTLMPGQVISGGSITAGTYILAQLTGTPGGVGTYSTTVSANQASTTVTATNTGKKVLSQGGNLADAPAIDAMAVGQIAFASGNPASSAYNKVITATTPSNMNGNSTLEVFYKPARINSYPLKNLKVLSNEIWGKRPVKATFQRYTAPTNAVWTMSSTQTVLANTRYEIGIDTFGGHIDENFSIQGQAYTGGVTTPDVISGTQVINRSFLFNQIGKDLNLMGPLAFPRAYGYNPVIVIGYKLDHTANSNVVPAASRTLNSALTNGTAATIPVWNTKSGMKSADLSGEQVTALKLAATTLSAGTPGANAAFVVIDTVVGDNLTAPAYTLDGLIFLSLDREKVAVDFDPKTRIQIRNVGASKGFAVGSNTFTQVTRGTEGTNTEMLHYMYKNDFRQRLYKTNGALELRQDEKFINYPNPVDLTKKYMVLTIESEGVDLTAMDGLTPVEPVKTVILAEDTLPADTLANSSATMNTIKLAFDQWLSNNGQDPFIA
jgi:hypothetical protein